MDLDEAVQAAKWIEPETAVPMHHLRRADPAEFTAKPRNGSKTVEPRTPGIGQVITLA
jgi:L-ascorbate metabolism protein UlaG (beta-lactamase superfamily)